MACLMVFLQHGIRRAFLYVPIENTIWERLLNVICNGGFGVSIFFVLSGFLITYLLITEHELNSKISLKRFYIRRTLRIWPLYFLIMLFSFLIYPFLQSLISTNNHPLGSNILYHLTFLSNFDVINITKNCDEKATLMKIINWSVSIEEQFYLFWPLIFLLPKRTWIYAILLVIISSITFRILHYNDVTVLYFNTIAVLVDLAMGGLVAYLIKTNNSIRAFFENSSTITHIILFACTFCFLFWIDLLYTFKYGAAIARIGISISFALIIAAQAITTSESKLNLSNISFANKWGKYTYGIYLIHPIPLALLDVGIRILHISSTNFITSLIIGMIAFILTLILSKMSYIYFESKFLILKDKFSVIKTLG